MEAMPALANRALGFWAWVASLLHRTAGAESCVRTETVVVRSESGVRVSGRLGSDGEQYSRRASRRTASAARPATRPRTDVRGLCDLGILAASRHGRLLVITSILTRR